jgi:hypothetical protein|tara:strand:+ start:1456 stop:1629 length:174 start_codon:yes stop_codon:yes gene_type:complete
MDVSPEKLKKLLKEDSHHNLNLEENEKKRYENLKSSASKLLSEADLLKQELEEFLNK